MAGLTLTLCLYATVMVVTARRLSLRGKLMAGLMGLMLSLVSVLLAARSAEILFLDAGHVWRHILSLVFLWVAIGAFMTFFWAVSMSCDFFKKGESL